MILELLEHGAAVSHKNSRGASALLEAADAGNFETMRVLQERGADVHVTNSHGDNAADLSKWGRDSDKIGDWLKKLGVVAKEEPEHHHGDHMDHGDHMGHGEHGEGGDDFEDGDH